MKVLLVRPPSVHGKGSAKPSVGLPLGLLYIAAVLKENGFSVEVYDAQINTIEPSYLLEDGRVCVGDKWDKIEKEISEIKPDLVGITCPFTAQSANAVKMAETVKKIFPGAVVVMGGNHATACYKDFFENVSVVDAVCIGEGEYTMLDIARAIESGNSFESILGIARKDGQGFKLNPLREYIKDLDQLPLPAYQLVNMEDYFLMNAKGFSGWPVMLYPGFERTMFVITSRGCPFDCLFCSVHLHMGRNWRFVSAENVRKHIEFLSAQYKVKHIHFGDDNLTLDINRFKNIIGDKFFQKLNITWDTPNGVRVDTLTRDVLAECKESGCVYLIFGVESGVQQVLDKIVFKKLDLNAVVKAAGFCKELEINAQAFYVIGFPGETKENINQTVDFALNLQKKYDINPSIFVATPLPGTDLEKKFFERGLLKNEMEAEKLQKMTQGAYLMDGDTFTSQDIAEALNRFYSGYKINFIVNVLLFFVRHPFRIIYFLRIIRGLKRAGKLSKESLLSILLYKKRLGGFYGKS
jgi:radical SAM superfamily enzyme YgiQ (UPF0313 family)